MLPFLSAVFAAILFVACATLGSARELPTTRPRILVLSTLDGGVVGLDATTGSRVFTVPAEPMQPAVSSWAAPGQPQYIPALNGALFRVHPNTGVVEQVDDVFLSPSSDMDTASLSEEKNLAWKAVNSGSSRAGARGRTISLRGASAIVLKHQHTSVIYINSKTGNVIRTIDFDTPAARGDSSAEEESGPPGVRKESKPDSKIPQKGMSGADSALSDNKSHHESDGNVILLSRTSVAVRVLDAASGRELANASVTHTTPSLLDGGLCLAPVALGSGSMESRNTGRNSVRFGIGVESMPLTSFVDAEHGKVTMTLGKDQGVLWSADMNADIIDAHGLGGINVIRRSNSQAVGQDKSRRRFRWNSSGFKKGQDDLRMRRSYFIKRQGRTQYAMLGDGSDAASSSVDETDFMDDSDVEDKQKIYASKSGSQSGFLHPDTPGSQNEVYLSGKGRAQGFLPMHRRFHASYSEYKQNPEYFVDTFVTILIYVFCVAALGVLVRRAKRYVQWRAVKGKADSDTPPQNSDWQRESAIGPHSNTDAEHSTGSKDSFGYGVAVRSESGWMKVGCLDVSSNVLGLGSHGTVVYEGKIMPGSRRVAVKRLLRQFYESARKEISFLVELDEASPYVVRYFAMEEDAEFIYLALELCAGALSDRVTADEIPAPPLSYTEGPLPRVTCRALRQLMQGLADLHKQNVVHRDLKPQNVLIARNASGGTDIKIADVGLALRLAADRSSYTAMSNMHGGVGTTGWRAPEVLSGARQTKAVDIFAAGCIVFYVVTGGKHPFGDTVFGRDGNIVAGTPDMSPLAGLRVPEAYDIVERLIANDPSARPSAVDALRHPFFWTDAMKLSFLVDISDRLYDLRYDSAKYTERLDQTEIARDHCSDWQSRMDSELMQELGGTYISCASNLLRVVRNKRNHYSELSARLQNLLGPLPRDDCNQEDDHLTEDDKGSLDASGSSNGHGGNKGLEKHNFLTYFLKRVPHLLMCVYSYALDNPELVRQPHFTRYGFKYSAMYSPLTLHPLVARLQSRSADDESAHSSNSSSTAHLRNVSNTQCASSQSSSERIRYSKHQLIDMSSLGASDTSNLSTPSFDPEIHSPHAWDRLHSKLVTKESFLGEGAEIPCGTTSDQGLVCSETSDAIELAPSAPPGFTSFSQDVPHGVRRVDGLQQDFLRPASAIPSVANHMRTDRGPPGFSRSPPRAKFGVDPHAANTAFGQQPRDSASSSEVWEDRRDRFRPWPSRKPALGFKASEHEERDWSGLRRDRV